MFELPYILARSSWSVWRGVWDDGYPFLYVISGFGTCILLHQVQDRLNCLSYIICLPTQNKWHCYIGNES